MIRSRNADITNDTLQCYINQIKSIPLLNFEEELDLSKRIQQGDQGALNALIQGNLRMVVKISRLYARGELSLLDIIQEGNIGLMRAAEKYDHRRNTRFSTYANPWIRQAISRFLLNRRRAIRLPNRKELTLKRIQKTYYSLSQSLFRKPRTEEIAQRLLLPVEDVDFILSVSSDLIPLDGDLENDEGALDFSKDYTYNPERALMRKSFHADIMRVLSGLKERERRVLIYRYQLNGCEPHTLKRIGEIMGISPETVRQIEMKALRKIRENAGELERSFYTE